LLAGFFFVVFFLPVFLVAMCRVYHFPSQLFTQTMLALSLRCMHPDAPGNRQEEGGGSRPHGAKR
jgi:hypothetical protein